MNREQLPDVPEDKAEAEKLAKELRAKGEHTKAYEIMKTWYFWYGK